MKQQILSQSAQWSNIDYQIQSITGKSTIKIINMYRYNDSTFDAHKQWQDAVVNVTDFSKQYCRNVADHSIPLEDVIFYAGHVNIHRYSNQPYKIFTFFLCKVSLGNVGKPETPGIQNCEAVMIHPQSQQEAFQYNFFLKTHQQYNVKYEVTFTVSDEKDFKLSEFECSNCENRTPTIFCSTEKLYFCEDCCSDHHRTKLMHTHKLQQIDKINTLEQCKNHNLKYEFYCLRCQKYLCNFCTQKGVHHQNIEHPIKPISYLYEETLENIEVLPKKPLQKIEVLLYNLKMKRKEIDDNFKEVKEQIVKQYQKSLKILQMQASKKYQTLQSCEIQLSLLKDKIEWGQSFSIFQYHNLKPIYYFQAEQRFQSELKKQKISEFEGIFMCKPDLVYDADIKIGSRDTVDKIRRTQHEQQYPANKPFESSQKRQRSPSHMNKVLSLGKSMSIGYDPNSQVPRKGELSVMIENSGLNFFQIKNK